MTARETHERSHEIPPKASIKLGPTLDEEVFGEAFNGQVVGRFMKYIAAYKVLLWVAITRHRQIKTDYDGHNFLGSSWIQLCSELFPRVDRRTRG
jgi:hypothetical protein